MRILFSSTSKRRFSESTGLKIIKLNTANKITTPDYLLLGNMHTDDVSQDVLNGLRLCDKADISLARDIIELLIKRNQTDWNRKNLI